MRSHRAHGLRGLTVEYTVHMSHSLLALMSSLHPTVPYALLHSVELCVQSTQYRRDSVEQNMRILILACLIYELLSQSDSKEHRLEYCPRTTRSPLHYWRLLEYNVFGTGISRMHVRNKITLFSRSYFPADFSWRADNSYSPSTLGTILPSIGCSAVPVCNPLLLQQRRYCSISMEHHLANCLPVH